jgi:hypothetical protein
MGMVTGVGASSFFQSKNIDLLISITATKKNRQCPPDSACFGLGKQIRREIDRAADYP